MVYWCLGTEINGRFPLPSPLLGYAVDVYGLVCTAVLVQLISGVFEHSVWRIRVIYGMYGP